jgi:hypothetical protein
VNVGSAPVQFEQYDDNVNYDLEPMDVEGLQPSQPQQEAEDHDEGADVHAAGDEPEGPLQSKRSMMFRAFLQKKFQESETISFNNMVQGKSRLTVAGSFYELLLFKTHKIINLKVRFFFYFFHFLINFV